jgi:hypothetical protein
MVLRLSGGSLTPWLQLIGVAVHEGDQCVRSAVICARASSADHSPVRPDIGTHVVREVEPSESACSVAAKLSGCDAYARRSHPLASGHAPGHHAVDVRPVLGTVQGSSLRSARADARPPGLDGSSAQTDFRHYVMADSSLMQPI